MNNLMKSLKFLSKMIKRKKTAAMSRLKRSTNQTVLTQLSNKTD